MEKNILLTNMKNKRTKSACYFIPNQSGLHQPMQIKFINAKFSDLLKDYCYNMHLEFKKLYVYVLFCYTFKHISQLGCENKYLDFNDFLISGSFKPILNQLNIKSYIFQPLKHNQISVKQLSIIIKHGIISTLTMAFCNTDCILRNSLFSFTWFITNLTIIQA